MKDRIIDSVSEQPTTQQTYRTPYQERTSVSPLEKQKTHVERIQAATNSVLANRHARLEEVLDIDIPTETPIFQKIMSLVMGESPVKEEPRGTSLRQLIQMESQLGAQIFGVIPAYDRREFYCFDGRMWIWHEERMNAHTGKHDVMTVSYNLTDRGVLKSFGENQSSYVQADELEHFASAVEQYAAITHENLYSKKQASYKHAA